MSNAVTAIFGANSTQFQSELNKMESLTAATGKRMSSSMGSSGHVAGLTGLIRETSVIVREIAMGRGIGRILGSFTLLIQYLNTFVGQTKQGVSAARELSNAYTQLAYKTQVQANMLKLKAMASEEAAFMEGLDNEATLAAATADAEAAKEAQIAATANLNKAKAAQMAADAEVEAAAAGAGILIPVAATAAIALVVYERIWGIKKAFESISGPIADIGDTYIPKVLRHTATLSNLQRDVRLEVEKTIDAYNSAAQVAERQAAATQKEFEHKKKMLEIQKEIALSSATTPQQKAAVEAEFDKKEIDLDKSKNAKIYNDKLNEKIELEKEANALENQFKEGGKFGKGSGMSTEEEDRKTLEQLTKKYEESKKNEEEKGVLHEAEKNAALMGANSPAGAQALKKAFDEAELRALADLASKKKAMQDQMDKNLEKDRQRKEAKEAEEKLKQARTGAVKIGEELKNLAETQSVEIQNKTQESKGKESARNAEIENAKISSGMSLNAQQKIGAYAAAPPDMKIQTDLLRQVAMNTAAFRPSPNAPPNSTPPKFSGSPGR